MENVVSKFEMPEDVSPEAPQRTAGTSTLDLALRALDLLAQRNVAMPLGELAKELGATKPTLYRHLVTLQRHGFVRQDARSGDYAAGVKLLILGEAVRSQFDVVATARPHLVELRDKTEQSSTLCALVGEELIVLEMIEGRSIIDFGTPRGTRLDFHASAHGRIWLAYGPHALTEQVMAQPLKAWTPGTLTSVAQLRREIEVIRAQGWATAPDEIVTGVNALAAPVFDHRGELAASVAIVGSTQFIKARPDQLQIDAVQQCAQKVSRECGWTR